MGYRNLKIDYAKQLRIKNQQLLIDEGAASVPLEDINSIIIENQAVQLSAYFLQKAAEYGIAIYVCNDKHMPSAVVLPMVRHSRHFKMLKQQIDISKPLQKRIWQQIVVQKIKNQSLCLKNMNMDGSDELLKMTKEVQSGDKTHVEAKAAAFYFKRLFGSHFTRADENIINSALNYGYTIIRGVIARSIICYGLEPSMGIFHHSELNSFNLADDFIEVFRPLVDLHVASKLDISETSSELTPLIKKDLFGIINYDMSMKGDKRIICNCIDILVSSYSSVLQGNKNELDLPELMHLQVHSYE